MFNEADNLRLLHARLSQALGALGDYEVVYVDDGSADASLKILKSLAQGDRAVLVVGLNRNSGQTPATQAGIDHSRGDIIVTMDADLQNDPADIPKLLHKLQDGYDVVCGWRRHRQDSFFNKVIPSFLGNSLIAMLFGVRVHDVGCSLRAYRRNALLRVRLRGQMHRLLPLYLAKRKASIAEIEVAHHRRLAGKSHYGWSRVFRVIPELIAMRFSKA